VTEVCLFCVAFIVRY